MKEEDIAYDFSIKVYKKFQQLVKSIVLFGSAAKNTLTKDSDIDIIIIIDDCTIQWDAELITWYREELGRIVAGDKGRDRLHVNTVTLSVFWEEVKNGEPVAINIIRYGKSLIDFGGLFEPLKILLQKGKIRPSAEAIYNALKRAPYHMQRANYGIFLAIDSLYWAMVDSAHAALMIAKQVPPSPEHIPEMLTEVLVKKRLLDKKYVEWFKEMYGLVHHLSRGAVIKIPGKKIELFRDRTDKFVGEMAKIVTKLE
ncbi:MAG: nucleotidyltransferase domain-containing protein [Nanoarchaeota archaeon]|nr:nucleotidyltransferase domain-containing protein [Nanoarchaeota archaeon]